MSAPSQLSFRIYLRGSDETFVSWIGARPRSLSAKVHDSDLAWGALDLAASFCLPLKHRGDVHLSP